MTKRTLLLLPLLALLTSCEKLLMGPDPADDPKSTFDYLWKEFDEQYALFDVKPIDWDSAQAALGSQIYDGMNNEELFEVCGTLLDLLHDGHVNLISGFDVHHDAGLYQTMVERSNIDEDCVMLHYLKPNYHSIGGLRHNSLGNGVAYIRYSSFSGGADSNSIRYIIHRYDEIEDSLAGLILDIRQNGGGNLQNVWNILKPFYSHGQPLYSTQSKSGKGHSDYAPSKTVFAEDNPSGSRLKVAVLTDRGCYSASSFFTLSAKEFDNFRVIGDTTGGGLGLPRNGQLPNGWYFRLSATRTLSVDGMNYENGVPPDEVVILDRTQIANGKDNVIERAKEWILEP